MDTAALETTRSARVWLYLRSDLRDAEFGTKVSTRGPPNQNHRQHCHRKILVHNDAKP